MTGTWSSGWSTGDIVTAAEFKKTAGSIYDTTLGASAASIDVTGISATYAHLMISIYARGDFAAALVAILARFNGDGAANYDYEQVAASAAVASATESFANTATNLGTFPGSTGGANLFGFTEVFIPNYAASTNNKQCISICSTKSGVASGNLLVNMTGGSWRSNAAINQITLLPSSGNFVAGTRVTIHALGA